MFPAARAVGALLIFALAAGFTRAEEADPEFEGMKVSKWVDVVQNDSSARKRALAVDALAKIWVAHKHKDAIPNIGRALRVDPSAAVRSQAAIVLAGMRAEDLDRFSKDLVDSLGTEKESRVRKQIIAAMVKFPETCVLGVEHLAKCLKDEDAAVKVAAAEAIATAGVKVKGSAKSAAPGLEPLLKSEDKAVRLAAIFALGRIEPEGASTIAETMAGMLGGEKDIDMKRELIASIGLLAEKSGPVVKALAAALFDAEDDVRRRAARVLGTFGTAAGPVADDLMKVMTTDKLKDIRVDALRAFGSALGPTGFKARLKDVRPLLDPAKQPDFEVRLALVDEIGSLGWEHLGVDLASADKGVKAEALDTIIALRGRLADPQVTVRKAAEVAIKKIEKKPEPKKEPEKKEP
jgi:HEAT repeat protein